MKNNTALRIEEMLTALKSLAIYGKTHLDIAKGLIVAKLDTGSIAPRFFEMTLDAHLQAAQMYAAKLYDKNSESVTVELLVRKADRSEARFSCAKPQDVRGAVEIARLMITNLKPILAAVQIRRNEYLAHLDPRTVIDIASMHARAALTIADLDRVLEDTMTILNLFSQLLNGTLSIPVLPGGDDYKVILKLAADALTAAPQ
jgi:AbiU2